jgi:hypothetical protein
MLGLSRGTDPAYLRQSKVTFCSLYSLSSVCGTYTFICLQISAHEKTHSFFDVLLLAIHPIGIFPFRYIAHDGGKSAKLMHSVVPFLWMLAQYLKRTIGLIQFGSFILKFVFLKLDAALSQSMPILPPPFNRTCRFLPCGSGTLFINSFVEPTLNKQFFGYFLDLAHPTIYRPFS